MMAFLLLVTWLVYNQPPRPLSGAVQLSCNPALAGGDRMQLDLRRRGFITLLGGAANRHGRDPW
jgi:hypothetical protein